MATEWEAVTGATVLAHLPTDVLAQYEAWLVTNPSRSGRLAEIVNNAVNECRDAIRTNKANTLDPDTTKIPTSAVRHIETISTFQLAMEIGLTIDTAGTQAMTRAEMFMRQLAYERFRVDSDDPEASTETPTYSIPTATSARALPGIMALMLLLVPSLHAGWIRPGSSIYETDVSVLYAPTAYTNTTLTLGGHLAGIDARLDDFYPLTGNPSGFLTTADVTGKVGTNHTGLITLTGAMNINYQPLGTDYGIRVGAFADNSVYISDNRVSGWGGLIDFETASISMRDGLTLSLNPDSPSVDSTNIFTGFNANFVGGRTAAELADAANLTNLPAALASHLSAYQSQAGFNSWATNRLQWVGAAPTTRGQAGSIGQVRGDVGGTNIYIHNGGSWGLAFTINTNALPP